jgi:hypothetical protein
MAINDNFKRIKVRAQAAVQNTSTSTSNANDINPKVVDWTRTRYDRILRAFQWVELIRDYNLSVTASTRDYALRWDVEDIIKIWDATNGREIRENTIQQHIRFTAPIEEVAGNVQTGQPSNYIRIGSKSVSALLSTADTIQVISTSANDVSPKVIRITGDVSGIPVSENIVLTGTSAATSSNTFDSGSELIIGVGSSSGTDIELEGVVTVREAATTSNTLSQIAPNDKSPYYSWIRLANTPAAALTANVWYKKKWLPLENDADVPIIPCANEIIEGVIADALYEDGQVAEAQLQDAKFDNSVRELFAARRGKNVIKQFVPDNSDTNLQTDRLFFS